MTSNHDLFINYNRKDLSMVHDSWFMVHESWIIQTAESSAFGVPLVLLWLSYGVLRRIRRAFEEGSKVIRRHTLIMNIDELNNKAGLVGPRTYIQEVMNISLVGTSKRLQTLDNAR